MSAWDRDEQKSNPWFWVVFVAIPWIMFALWLLTEER